MYWQAVVVHNLVVLQQGEDVAFVYLCDSSHSTVAGPTALRDNVLAIKCEYPLFRHPAFKCARLQGPRELPGTVRLTQRVGFGGCFRSRTDAGMGLEGIFHTCMIFWFLDLSVFFVFFFHF